MARSRSIKMFNVWPLRIFCFYLGFMTAWIMIELAGSDSIAIIDEATKLVLAGAAVATVFLGYMGFNKWQVETVGKRRVSIAEDILIKFHGFSNSIRSARNHREVNYEEDGVNIEYLEVESDFEHKLEAMRRVSEKLMEGLDKRYEFLELEGLAHAFFGEKVSELIEECHEMEDRFLASMTYTLGNANKGGYTEELFEPCFAIVFSEYDGVDEVKNQLGKIRTSLEAEVLPYIEPGRIK